MRFSSVWIPPSEPAQAHQCLSLLLLSLVFCLSAQYMACKPLGSTAQSSLSIYPEMKMYGELSTLKAGLAPKTTFSAALMSWKYNMLLIFKFLLHWLLGQSVQPSFDYGGGRSNVWFAMNYAHLFVYVICTTIFASAITFLTFMKPKGPQPATYGHIQTIADVIGDWTLEKNGRFWWGDKGCREAVRHAG